MTSDFIPLPEPSPSDAPTRRQPRRSPGAKRGSTHAAKETYVEERALIRRLLDREPAAWNEFIQRYERLIVSRILATCRETDSEAPADLVEDCGAEVMAALFHRKMSGQTARHRRSLHPALRSPLQPLRSSLAAGLRYGSVTDFARST